MCVCVCVCVCVPWGGREKNGLICRCYTRLTLPPFHLFNERNIRSSNGERFEIGNDLLLTHTYGGGKREGGGSRVDGVGRGGGCVFSLKQHNPSPLWIMAIFRDCNSRTNS